MGKAKDLKCEVFRLGKKLILKNTIKEYETSRPITMYESKIPEAVREELRNKILNLKI